MNEITQNQHSYFPIFYNADSLSKLLSLEYPFDFEFPPYGEFVSSINFLRWVVIGKDNQRFTLKKHSNISHLLRVKSAMKDLHMKEFYKNCLLTSKAYQLLKYQEEFPIYFENLLKEHEDVFNYNWLMYDRNGDIHIFNYVTNDLKEVVRKILNGKNPLDDFSDFFVFLEKALR